MAERIVGIDFGTSTSVVRVMRFQEDGTPIGVPKAVTFNNGETTVPTVVQKLQNGENAYFGHDAERPKGRGARVFRNFKLNLESEDEEVREEAKELTAYFLKQLGESYKHQSDVGLLGESTDKVKTYISYPVKWRPETRDFMVKATIDAGFPNVEGMDEAEACVKAIKGQYAYELIRNGYLKADVPCTVLLIDMGAGTTDLVLCRYTPSKKVKILTTWPTKGDLRFGGAEVDTLLYQYIRDAFPESGLIIDRLRLNNGDAFKSWKQDTVSPYLLRKESVDYFAALEGMLGEAEFDPIDRGVFEKLAQAYLPQFPRLINEALEAGKLSGADVDLVILTGGHSRWYFAREMLEGKLPRFGHLHLDRIQQDPKRIVSLGDLAQETVALGLIRGDHDKVFWEKEEAKQEKKEHFSEVVERIRLAAEKGDVDAKKWYLKAAEQGYAKAPQALLKVEGKQTEKHYSLEKTVDKKTESQKRKHESVFPLEYNPKSLQRPVIAAVSSDTIAGVKKGSEEIAVIPCGYYGDKAAYLKSDGVAYIKDADAQENELIARERVIAIASSGSCLFGLKENGTVVCLNRNQTDIPNLYKKTADWRHIKALYGMSCDCGLFGIQGDGTVVYAGKSTDIEAEVANWRDVISISGSITICVGLTSTGRVLAAGGYIRWLRKNIPPDIAEWDNIIAVSADDTHVVGLKKDGSVITTEDPKGAGRPCCLVEAWQDTIAISASHNSTVGLRADGTILFTGSKRPELVGTKLF